MRCAFVLVCLLPSVVFKCCCGRAKHYGSAHVVLATDEQQIQTAFQALALQQHQVLCIKRPVGQNAAVQQQVAANARALFAGKVYGGHNSATYAVDVGVRLFASAQRYVYAREPLEATLLAHSSCLAYAHTNSYRFYQRSFCTPVYVKGWAAQAS